MAGGKRKDEPGADDIMSPAQMKPLLNGARRGATINCALAMTADRAGVVLLDRRRSPKQLLMDLRQQAIDVGLEIMLPTLRFGQALVSGDDPRLVTFAVNKEATAALRPKLLVLVKRTGFKKVAFALFADLDG